VTAGVPPADAAWVIVDTPLSPERLVSFCADVERLYRINPYLEVRYWRPRDASQVEVAFRNLSNGRDVEVRCTIEKPAEDEVVVRYDRGIKSRTCFRIQPAPGGSRLTITDDYGGAAAHPANDTSEVDRSLHAWGVALRDYLLREARWARYAPWRWYMRRVWLPMKPAARRITFVILMVALAEIVLIALVMAIYWAEQLR
jgi:hypothetical protein